MASTSTSTTTTSTPQSMMRTDLSLSLTDKYNHRTSDDESDDVDELSPPDPQAQQRRIMLPPIRTLLNEQLSMEPQPNSASSTSSMSNRLTSASHHPQSHRRPLVPSHSSSHLMDMHDCILNKQLRRERRRHQGHTVASPPHSSGSGSSSPRIRSYDRRPSISQSQTSSRGSSALPSPTDSTSNAGSWVSQFSLQMNMNMSQASSPISSSSGSSLHHTFPGPLDSKRRQDTGDTIKAGSMLSETDCTPMYGALGEEKPKMQIQKKSCGFAPKRLWELPLCVAK